MSSYKNPALRNAQVENVVALSKKAHDIIPYKQAPQETKSFKNVINIFEYLSQTGWGQVTAWQALRYYEQIAPVATAVDKITDEIKSLQPAIFNKQEQSYEASHKFLDFLQHPNAAISGTDFLKNYSTYYEVTGEVYLMATGNPNKPPLETFVVTPQFVTINPNSRDGFPESYVINNSTNTGGVTFTRKEINKRFRFFDSLDRELWHIKDFNPNASSTNFHGASRLNPIFYEIEQYLAGSIHNLSLLKKGGRLTGALVTDQVLSDPVFARLKEEVSSSISGADNAGRVPVFDSGISYTEMGKNNRDMDFLNLMNSKEEAIFKRLNIPLALMTTSVMTLNNAGTAQIALFDNAVLPVTSKLFGELTLFIGPRFGLNENEVLSVDPSTIPALRERALNNLLKQSKLYILSDNEQRAMLGRESREGGDDIFKPANLVPVGEDTDTTGNREKPAARSKFIEILRECKDLNGDRKWNDGEIEAMAEEQGLT